MVAHNWETRGDGVLRGGAWLSRFVLIHGAWHGAWCWYKVVTQLESAGHQVLAIDLPSLGKDRSPLAGATLQGYTESVCAALDEQPEPAILVGHSMGGIAISQAAERMPDRIQKLVYLTAFLLRDGESLIDKASQGPTRVTGLTARSTDRLSTVVNLAMIREIFYAQCPDEDVALATLLLQPQTVAPMATAQSLTAARFGRVPKVYIECLRDKVIDPALQKAMYQATPCEKVLSIDTDHSPFFSRPEELVAHLAKL
jgi:pimeloyl-ACP methyl ester carboxylesterase